MFMTTVERENKDLIPPIGTYDNAVQNMLLRFRKFGTNSERQIISKKVAEYFYLNVATLETEEQVLEAALKQMRLVDELLNQMNQLDYPINQNKELVQVEMSFEKTESGEKEKNRFLGKIQEIVGDAKAQLQVRVLSI